MEFEVEITEGDEDEEDDDEDGEGEASNPRRPIASTFLRPPYMHTC